MWTSKIFWKLLIVHVGLSAVLTVVFLMSISTWQAILAAYTWVWWRESRNPWFLRIIVMELVFLAFFGEWYVNRYLHIGPQFPFGQIVAAIVAVWLTIAMYGLWHDRSGHSV